MPLFLATNIASIAVSLGAELHGQDINVNNTGRAGASAAGIAGYSVTLTTTGGNQTYNTTQTFSNIRFTGKVLVTGGNVVFEFCQFEAQPEAAASALHQYDGGAECGTVTCNWCTFDSGLRGAQGNFETCGFQAGERGQPATQSTSSFTLNRCSFQGYGNLIGIHKWLNSVSSSIVECFVSEGTTGNATHTDGIEYYSSNNVSIQRCRLTIASQSTAVLNIAPMDIDFPSPGNPILIKDNYLNGGGLTIICGDDITGNYSDIIPNIQFIGNRFGDQNLYGQLCDFAGNDATYNLAYHSANLTVPYWAISNVWAPNGEGVENLPVDSKDLPHVDGAFVSAANFGSGSVWVWDGQVLDFGGAVPVVTPASFTLAAGYGLDAFIGHVDATNTPTSYAIVSGNPSSYVEIYSSGNLRTSASVPAPPAVYSLGVTATNANGTSASAAVGVTLQAAATVLSVGSGSYLISGTTVGIFVQGQTNVQIGNGSYTVGGTAVGFAVSGGFDSTYDWPDASNRPSFSGSTLSWIGPSAGGVSTTADIAQSHNLTNSGPVTSSSNNQVIEYLNITGSAPAIDVNHSGVTVRRCRVSVTGASPVISLANGTVMEDCLIFSNIQNGFYIGNNVILRRCNIFGMENHIRSGSDITVIDCWIHNAVGSDCDMIELDGNNGGGESDNWTIAHNTFDGRDKGTGFLNSAINLTNYLGPVTNIHITGNRFLNMENVAINDDNHQGGGSVTMSVQNNSFYSSTFRRNGAEGADSVSPNSGNYVPSNLDNHTGSATNGTGAI